MNKKDSLSDKLERLRTENERLAVENTELKFRFLEENAALKRQLAAAEQLNEIFAAELDKLKEAGHE